MYLPDLKTLRNADIPFIHEFLIQADLRASGLKIDHDVRSYGSLSDRLDVHADHQGLSISHVVPQTASRAFSQHPLIDSLSDLVVRENRKVKVLCESSGLHCHSCRAGFVSCDDIGCGVFADPDRI